MTDDRPQPFGSRNSSYHGYENGELVKLVPAPTEADPLAALVHNQLRAMLLSKAYTCLGAAAAMRKERYRLGVYPALCSPEAVDEHAADLTRFTEEYAEPENPVAVFVSVFDGPVRTTDSDFESDLWNHLAALDGRNPRRRDAHPNPGTSADSGFVYSGRNFFVVGLHPGASRWARRFAWPTLVFNALSHGDPLRKAGQFDRMTHRIRDRDRRLQGMVNPSLEYPRISQFSGRAVSANWVCPVRIPQDDTA